MRQRVGILLSAALVAVTIGVLSPAPPASATGLCPFEGTMITSAPFTYPVTVVPLFLSEPTRVTVHQPVTTTFNFAMSIGICANTTGTTTTLKSFTFTGVMSGWCGHSSATGVTSDGYRFAWVDVGGLAVFTGGLVGVVNITPDLLSGHTCNAHKGQGAWAFLLSGVVAKTHCNVVKQKGLTTMPTPVSLQTLFVFNPVVRVDYHTGQNHVWWKFCFPDLAL